LILLPDSMAGGVFRCMFKTWPAALAPTAHTHTQTFTHKHSHTQTHTQRHRHTHTHTNTKTHTYINTRIRTNTFTHKHKHIRTHAYIQVHIRTNTIALNQTHIKMQAHAYIHMHRNTQTPLACAYRHNHSQPRFLSKKEREAMALERLNAARTGQAGTSTTGAISTVVSTWSHYFIMLVLVLFEAPVSSDVKHTNTCTRACTHTPALVQRGTPTPSLSCAHNQSHILALTHSVTNGKMQGRFHTHTHTHTHACMYAFTSNPPTPHTPACTHSCTHTHAHTIPIGNGGARVASNGLPLPPPPASSRDRERERDHREWDRDRCEYVGVDMCGNVDVETGTIT
jgi:hypothetical protein